MSRMKKEVLDNGKCIATFLKETKTFISEKHADQWLLEKESEYLITRQPFIKHTLTLDEIDGGVWVNEYHKKY